MSSFWKKFTKVVAGVAVFAALAVGAADAAPADDAPDQAAQSWSSTNGQAWS